MAHDSESADPHLARTRLVQGATDADEVFRFGGAGELIIIWVIHASASSKLEKR